MFRRSRSLGRTAAHTAVVVGTANAVNGRAMRRHHDEAVRRREADAAQQQAPAAAPGDDPIARIERLAALHASGAITAEEFATLKAAALA